MYKTWKINLIIWFQVKSNQIIVQDYSGFNCVWQTMVMALNFVFLARKRGGPLSIIFLIWLECADDDFYKFFLEVNSTSPSLVLNFINPATQLNNNTLKWFLWSCSRSRGVRLVYIAVINHASHLCVLGSNCDIGHVVI